MTRRMIGASPTSILETGPAVGPATIGAKLSAHWRWVFLIAAIAIGGAGRIAYGWGAPFWFDESFSGVIATQPSVAALIGWCLSEVTGPGFYMPLWVWEKIAGSSDAALRAPSLILSFAAPALILWRGDRDRDLRLFWAVSCLLWVPSFIVAGEARGYPQLFFLGVAQAIVFVRLIEHPNARRALWWTGISAIAVLSHYHAALPATVQGIAYLIVHRRVAVRTWPALIALVPVAGWAAFHLPMLRRYAGAHEAAYAPLPLSDLVSIPAFVFGVPLHGALIIAVVAVSLAVPMRKGAFAQTRPSPALVLSLCAIVSVALMIAFGFVWPGFAPRYLTPSMPALLFALALWARSMMPRDSKPVIVVFAVMFLMAGAILSSSLTEPDRDPRHLFNLERPSAWLAEAEPRRVVMLWDGPIGAASDDGRLSEVGGFFFKRAGHPVAVDLVRLGKRQDPNTAVIERAGGRADTGILWIANDLLPQARKPALAGRDPALECRDFGEGVVTMTACRRR